MIMRRVIATLLMIVLSTPVRSGVGDVYYCVAYNAVGVILLDNKEKLTIEENELSSPKITFKWTEKGMVQRNNSGGEPKLYKFSGAKRKFRFKALGHCPAEEACGFIFNDPTLLYYQAKNNRIFSVRKYIL